MRYVGLDVHWRQSSLGRSAVVAQRREWQKKAGFDRLYSAVTNVYRQTRDLFLAQRFARHVSPLTTVVYTHPSDQEMRDRLRGLGC